MLGGGSGSSPGGEASVVLGDGSGSSQVSGAISEAGGGSINDNRLRAAAVLYLSKSNAQGVVHFNKLISYGFSHEQIDNILNSQASLKTDFLVENQPIIDMFRTYGFTMDDLTNMFKFSSRVKSLEFLFKSESTASPFDKSKFKVLYDFFGKDGVTHMLFRSNYGINVDDIKLLLSSVGGKFMYEHIFETINSACPPSPSSRIDQIAKFLSVNHMNSEKIKLLFSNTTSSDKTKFEQLINFGCDFDTLTCCLTSSKKQETIKDNILLSIAEDKKQPVKNILNEFFDVRKKHNLNYKIICSIWHS